MYAEYALIYAESDLCDVWECVLRVFSDKSIERGRWLTHSKRIMKIMVKCI